MKYCSHCGKELLDEAVICLNCGCKSLVVNTASSSHQISVQDKVTEPKLAIWSKIIGITSFFIGWFAFGIIAMILAHLSKKETRGKMCSSARVGFVCGVVSTALSLLIIFGIIGVLISLYVSFIGVLESFMTFLEPLMKFLEFIMEIDIQL